MDRLHKWLWLTVKCNITLAKVRNLIDYFGDIDKVYSAKPNEYLKLNFLDDKEMSRLANKSVDGIEGFLKTLSDNNVKVVTIDMPEYPYLLKHIYDPPFVLYCRGKFLNLNDYMPFSIIGTRKPTPYGINIVNDMAFKIATVTVVGFNMGNTTLKKVCRLLQPSIVAASSISRGIPFTKPVNINTLSPAPNPR